MNTTSAPALVSALLGLALAGGLTGCSTGSTTATAAMDSPPASVTSLTAPIRVGVTDFAAVVATPGVEVIDVRTPSEYAAGHIRGAVNIPVQSPDFAARVAALDPAGTYAVYCRSGNRSQPAVAAMEQAGIAGVYELAPGTNGWMAEGQPLVR